MIEIREVKTRKEKKEFLNFPLDLYDKNPYFVPPLYGDEKKIFDKDYVYYDQSEAIYFNAYKDGKIVGRISGILQKASNEKWKQKRVRFTRFDSIDDQEVAHALFSAVENWAKEKNMEEVVGPLGFSDLEREGLLIEGFDELSTFEEQYNYAYYQKLIENEGYIKDVDWVERKLYLPKEIDPRIKELSEKILEKYDLKIAKCKNINQFIKQYGDKFFEILDQTYDNIYGTVPFTDGMRKMMIDNFKMILDLRYVAVVVDKDDNIVCFGLCMPSLSKAVQKSKGHLTLPTIFRILRAVKKPEIVDLALIGVIPEYKMKGVGMALISKVYDILNMPGVKYCETNLNLEDNHNIQNQWKNFDSVLHKRRRSFIKKIA